MKYIKKFETNTWEPKDNIQGLKEMFNLVLPNPEVFKIPYSYRDSKYTDFNIYVVSGVRCERDDHKFLQELYHNNEILNEIYNLEFFNITLSKTKTHATIVLYDYINNPNYNKNFKNYISHNIIESKLPLPSNIKERLKPGMLYKNNSYYLTKGILYSNGNSGNLNLYSWIYEQPEDFRKQYEDINVPIKVGDTILGGRFKNKRILVKKIGKNKKGDITINDKPLLKFRLLKESISQEDIDNGLVYLKDDGFKIIVDNTSNNLNGIIQIFKQKEFKDHNTMDNLIELNWSDIESDLLPFIEVNKDFIKDVILTYSTFTTYSGTSEIKTYDRDAFSVDEILEDKDFGKILKVNIRLK
jgi:hypothetical protein